MKTINKKTNLLADFIYGPEWLRINSFYFFVIKFTLNLHTEYYKSRNIFKKN